MHKKRIFKFFRVSISAVLAFSMIFGQIGSSLGISYAQEVQAEETESEYVEETVEASNAAQYGLAENTKQGAILHAWCWSFNTIKENMKDIAEAGFSTVQTSPANTCIVGENGGMELWGNGKWYYHYQPIDWKIGNYQLGSRDDFKAMCEEADKYGVKIIVDVLPNHTSADRGAVTQGLIEAAGGMDKLYHKNWDVGCDDWTDRNKITNYKYSTDGCPDVCTENPGFQKYYVEYLNDLIECGVDGFRYDTAKHIGLPDDPIDEVTRNNGWSNNFWPVALGEQSVGDVKLNGSTDTLFVYGEVLQDAGSRDADYGKLFNLTASNYGGKLRSAIRDKNFNVNTLSGWENAAGADRLVTWVESHDTYCNSHESGWMTDWDIRMAWAVIAARASGTPLFYSRPDGSNGSQGNYWGNNKIGAKGNDQFKDPEVAAVNFFRNAMAGESEYLRNPDGNNQILQIDRGTKGTCIINLGGATSINNDTTMADGTYTDQVSGREFTVSGGKISGQLDGGKIAVIYNKEDNNMPQVNASVSSGTTFTTDTQEVTFTVTNATSATYSIDGGAATSFTDSVKVILGENTAFGNKITVTVTATNADGTTEKTFTYTKKEAGKLEKNTVYFTKPSDWSTAKIYAYIPGNEVTKLTGEWSGTAMTDEGDGVYSYTFAESVSTCKVIFTDGSNQTPANVQGETCGYDYTSGKAYTYNTTDGWVAVAVSDVTATPIPTNTPVPTVTEAPAGIKINSSLADNSSFSTETATIKLTLENAEKGTYCVDDGPVKEFTNSADVVIGKGKIADSTVTVKVTAEGNGETATKTFTYTKEYVATYSNATVNAGADMEEVVEEIEVNATLSNDSLASQYATNANGVGAKKSITVDGDISDWNSSMLIAQGAANDDPRVYKSASMHELPVDLYALYGAYDDNNLYLMWEMTNVQDVVAPAEDYPLSQGILFQTQEFPFHILIDTGKSDTAIGNSGKTQTGGTIWNTGLTTTNSFNKWICFNTKGGNGPWVYGGDSTGVNEVELLGPKTTESNISVKFGKGILSEKVVGINDAYGTSEFGSHNRVVGDVCDNSAAWADFNTLGHSSSTMDFHYEVSIPLSELGISASDVENTGVGVLLLSTFGLSAMDCLPYDVAMNDNADQDDTQSQPGNSFEKSDADNVTCTFARIGNGDIPTQRPTAVPTTEPTAVPTTEPTAVPTDVPDITQIPGGDMAVNFGADRSAPQYNSTALEIKAEVTGGTAPYSYEFFVDDASVKSGTENTYTWQNGSAGAHTIKVVVTDSTGKTATVTKEYDLEQDGDTPINTPIPISTVTPVPTGTVTTAPLPTSGGGNTSSDIQLTKLLVSCITEDGRYKIGDTYILRAEAENAVGTPQYMFTYILNGEEVIVKNYGPETEARFVATEPGKYSFKVYVVDNSNDANPEFETGEINIVDVPGITIIPNPTNAPVVTNKPTVTPSVTETPVTSVAPTNTPVATQNPATPTKAAEPSKGSVVNVGKAAYKVTGTGSSKTVEYTGYTGTEATVTIPSTVKFSGANYKVTSIASKAFKGNTKVKVVKIPANVTKIGKEAFSGCTNLTTVKSGTNVASIGDKAFYNCKKLSSITLSKKLTTIGKSAFYKCIKLKKITLNSKVKKIGSKAFYGCKNLKTITIKTKKLTSKNVGSSAFKGINSKATIKVPSSKMKAYKKLLKSKGAGSKVSYKKA